MTKDDHPTMTAVQENPALRIRPLSDRDRNQPRFSQLAQDDVLQIIDKTVRVAQHNKQFTFDYVFGADSRQDDVFSTVGQHLIHKFLEGYNVTILAYGQTSSGKTYTMGTAQHEGHADSQQAGIVPRAMALLFDTLASRKPAFAEFPPSAQPAPDFSVKVSFIELYNEEVKDLLNSAPPAERAPVLIREDTKGQIYWSNVKEVSVHNTDQVLAYLEQGTLNRATGATDMNEQSSRSHAIFSVSLQQKTWVPHAGGLSDQKTRPRSVPALPSSQGEWLITTSKFHFVDLAGSERLKRTAAEGDRRKEGININAGLLALGNVISALGDPSKRSTHVPYRDSKLTRLLQDSLGGNATTLMIACVSPVEYNISETLSTLQYANRARNIKNKAERNEVEEWMTTDNLELLRSMIAPLKAEIRRLKRRTDTPPPNLGDRESPASPIPTRNLSSSENERLCQEQRSKIVNLQQQLEELRGEASAAHERSMLLEEELDRRHKRGSAILQSTMENFPHLVEPVIEEYEKSFSAFESQLALTRAALNHSDDALRQQTEKLETYERQIENQKKTIVELRQRVSELVENSQHDTTYIEELESRLMSSVDEMVKDRKLLAELKHRIAELKETDETTEQYIVTLEQRLADSEAERTALESAVEELETKLFEKLEGRKSELTSTDDMDTLREFDEPSLCLVGKETSKPDLYDEGRHYKEEGMRTLESSSTLNMEDMERKAEEESQRVSYLEDQLSELKKTHEATLKDLDDTLRRHQEAMGQVRVLKETSGHLYDQDESHSFENIGHQMSEARTEAYAAEREAHLYQIDILQETIADLQTQLSDAVGHAAVHETKIRELKTTISHLEKPDKTPAGDSTVKQPERVEDKGWHEQTSLHAVCKELEHKLKEAITRCDTKQAQIDALAMENESSFAETNTLHAQLEETERELEYAHEELDALDCALKIAQEESAKLRQERDEKALEHASRDQAHKPGSTWERDTIQRLQDELTELEEQLLNKEDTAQTLEQLLSQFKTEKEQTMKRLHQAEASAEKGTSYQIRVNELEDQLATISAENTLLQDKAMAIENMATDITQSDATTASPKEALDKIEALETMLRSTSVEKQRFADELKAAKDISVEAGQKLIELNETLEQATSEQRRLKADKEDAHAKIQCMENVVEQYEKSIEKERRAKEESIALIQRLESTVEQLMDDLSLAQVANQEKETDLTTLQSKIEMHQSTIAELENALQQVPLMDDDKPALEHDDTADVAAQTALRVTELEKSVEALQKEKETYAAMSENLAVDLKASEEGMQLAKNKVAALEEQLLIKSKEAQMGNLLSEMVPQSVVDTLQDELQKRDTEMTRIYEKNKRLQGEKMEMQKRYEAQSKELAAVQADVKGLNSRLADTLQRQTVRADCTPPTRGASPDAAMDAGDEARRLFAPANKTPAREEERRLPHLQPQPTLRQTDHAPPSRVGDKDLQRQAEKAENESNVRRLQQELDTMETRLQERERGYLATLDEWKTRATSMARVNEEKQALEQKLAIERDRSAKVQKALEDQIEMLLSKKNKFICF